MNIYNCNLYWNFKKLLLSNKFTKNLFVFIHRKKAEKKQLKKSVPFQKYIHRFYPVIIKNFDSLGIDYFICFGTLLGAIREHDFIKHDFDLEFGVFSDQYYSQLAGKFEEAGFKKQYRYYMADSRIPNEGFVEKYSNGYIHFDLFVFSRDKENIWCWSYLKDEANVLNAIKLSWKNTGLKRIEFQGLSVPAPVEPEKFLEALYGITWNIPCVYWEDTLAGNIAEINKKDGRFQLV